MDVSPYLKRAPRSLDDLIAETAYQLARCLTIAEREDAERRMAKLVALKEWRAPR